MYNLWVNETHLLNRLENIWGDWFDWINGIKVNWFFMV